MSHHNKEEKGPLYEVLGVFLAEMKRRARGCLPECDWQIRGARSVVLPECLISNRPGIEEALRVEFLRCNSAWRSINYDVMLTAHARFCSKDSVMTYAYNSEIAEVMIEMRESALLKSKTREVGRALASWERAGLMYRDDPGCLNWGAFHRWLRELLRAAA